MQHPVLILLTALRSNAFALCVECMDRFTDLRAFKRIYIIANAVAPEHREDIAAFAARHPHVEVVDAHPRGLVPAVMHELNAILAQHADDLIVKVDEDLFVTPHWLQHLTGAWRVNQRFDNVVMASTLPPVSSTGRLVMRGYLTRSFAREMAALPDVPIHENIPYHGFIWQKTLSGELERGFYAHAAEPWAYVNHIVINCVLFGPQLMEAVLPFPTEKRDGTATVDEWAINRTLLRRNWHVAVTNRCITHHYAHADCEQWMRANFPIERVAAHMRTLAP